jgi:hypothetical protein
MLIGKRNSVHDEAACDMESAVSPEMLKVG